MLRAERLEALPVIASAHGLITRSAVSLLGAFNSS